MRLLPWMAGVCAAGAGTLLYGAAVEAYRLSVQRHRLMLPLWPRALNGYRIALLADFHLQDQGSLALAQRAVDSALDERPDAIALTGDAISYWREGSLDLIIAAHERLGEFPGPKVAVPGNHDHRGGSVEWMRPIFEELGIHLLRNECLVSGSVAWVGIDSAMQRLADPTAAFRCASKDEPKVVLWHEPDFVGLLPPGSALMLAGHSHGGQFTFPWGWTPMYTKGGRRYPRGFYQETPTPLYVSRGIGVTGPPSRLCCTPEVSILELWSDQTSDEPTSYALRQ